MDTLDLVGSNDDVLEGTAVRNLEDGIGVTALRLAGARGTTVVHLHATVKGLAGSNGVDTLEDRRAGGSGQVETLLDVMGAGGRGDLGSGRGDGTDSQRSDEKCVLHFERVGVGWTLG